MSESDGIREGVTIPNYPRSLPLSYQNFDLGGGGSGTFKYLVTADPPEVVKAFFQLHLGPPDRNGASAPAVWHFPAPEGASRGGQLLEVRPAGDDPRLWRGSPVPPAEIQTVIHVSSLFFPRGPQRMI